MRALGDSSAIFASVRAMRLAVLIAILAGLTACDSSSRMAIRQAELQQECFGNVTNTCSSKNIDFDIDFLRSISTEQWIPFEEVPTKQQMIGAFGDQGWTLFEQSVGEVREQFITHLESRRPGWFSRWFQGDEPPFDGGVGAFTGPEPIQLAKDEIRKVFAQKLKKAGWHPSPEAAKQYGGLASAPSAQANDHPAASSAEPANNDATGTTDVAPPVSGTAESASQNNAAADVPPGETSAPGSIPQASEMEALAAQQWQRVKIQVSKNPDAVVLDCMNRHVATASEQGGMSREEASKGLLESCQGFLTSVRACAAMNPDNGQKCYAELTADAE